MKKLKKEYLSPEVYVEMLSHLKCLAGMSRDGSKKIQFLRQEIYGAIHETIFPKSERLKLKDRFSKCFYALSKNKKTQNEIWEEIERRTHNNPGSQFNRKPDGARQKAICKYLISRKQKEIAELNYLIKTTKSSATYSLSNIEYKCMYEQLVSDDVVATRKKQYRGMTECIRGGYWFIHRLMTIPEKKKLVGNFRKNYFTTNFVQSRKPRPAHKARNKRHSVRMGVGLC